MNPDRDYFEARRIVAKTIRYLLNEGYIIPDELRPDWINTAKDLDVPVISDGSCPVCDEGMCDEGCPLEEYRSAEDQDRRYNTYHPLSEKK